MSRRANTVSPQPHGLTGGSSNQEPNPEMIPLLQALDGRSSAARITELVAATGLTRERAARRLGMMEAAGLVRQDRGRWRIDKPGRAVLAAATAPQEAAPGASGLRARLWTALRKLGKASVPDLVTMAAAGDEANAESNARQFLAGLAIAGYVTALPRRGSQAARRFVLVRDSGPGAPIVSRRRGEVRDPNTGETFAIPVYRASADD